MYHMTLLVLIANEFGIYFGYREAWYLLTHGSKEQKRELSIWLSERKDCTFNAVMDYYRDKYGLSSDEYEALAKELLSSDLLTLIKFIDTFDIGITNPSLLI